MRLSLSNMALAALLLVWTSDAFALRPPKVGRQYLTVGYSLQPGLMIDDDTKEVDSPSFTAGNLVRFGLQHVVAPSFYMAAELELGAQWMNEHTAAADGIARSENAFAWQVAIIGRFVPGADDGGWHLGGGLQWFNASLDDAPLQVLAFDLRSGFYIWRDDSFALFEAGYALPFIAGLDFPTDFSGMAPSPVPQNWSMHRFLISFNYGW